MDKKLAKECLSLYRSQMETFLNSSGKLPTSIQLRQRHQELAFECMDLYRKRSGQDAADSVWKLEQDLKDVYHEYQELNNNSRHMALMRYALDDPPFELTPEEVQLIEAN